MRRWFLTMLCALGAGAGLAEGERAGAFDYYVMALSWTPNWCRLEGDAKDAELCETSSGWSLHGLWPQYEKGWPSFCRTSERDPSRRDTAAQADLFGASGFAWHQWKKHGRCSGLSAQAYYDLAREAYGSVTRPSAFRKLENPARLPAKVVEQAFLAENRTLRPDGLTVTCRDGHIHEVRICLSKDLEPRSCGADVVRDCDLERAYLAPIR